MCCWSTEGTIQTLPMDPNIQGSFLFNNNLNQFPSDLKGPVCQYSVPNSFYKLNPGLNSQLQPGTPHGINDILSRSMVGVGSTGTTTLLSGYSTMGGFGPSVTSTSMYYNRDYNPSLGSFSKIGTECPMKSRSVSCWAESTCDWRGRQQCSNSECQWGRLSLQPAVLEKSAGFVCEASHSTGQRRTLLIHCRLERIQKGLTKEPQKKTQLCS